MGASNRQMKPNPPLLAGFILLFIPYFAYSADFLIQPPQKSMTNSIQNGEKPLSGQNKCAKSAKPLELY